MDRRVYASRLSRLAGIAEEEGACAYIVAGDSSIFYYTGYHGAGLLAVSPGGGAWLLVPVLEYLSALHQLEDLGLANDLEVVVYTPYGLPEKLVTEESGVKVVRAGAVEAVAELSGCRGKVFLASDSKSLWDRSTKVFQEVLDGNKHVYEMRMVKEPWELERMATAARIAEAALERALGELREGVSENEVAGLLYYEMRRRGAEDYSFPPIVAFGVNSVYPHARPASHRLLRRDMPVLIDLGAKYDGYSSDMTRTLYYGSSTPPEFRHIAEAVREAMEAGIEAVREGVKASEVDAAARRVLEDYKVAKYFIHSLGHGIGVDVHEPPRVTFSSNTVLREGMVITIEPGVYIPGKFGVRIEEMVLVTKRRGVRLTRFPTQLW